MTESLRLILPLYFIVYFGIAFVLKSLIVAKRIGKNPLVLPSSDNAYGIVGLYFKLMLIAMFVYVALFSCFPAWHQHFLPIVQLELLAVQYTGLALLAIALIWTIIAQSHMRNSWRIGIDTETKTELVTTGLFGVCRNPIFLGMILCLVGLFLTTPNALTGLFWVLGYVLIQIQIRLEEAFLESEHGQIYVNYKQRVRRLVWR